jgi:PEP-CTERM motif
MHIAKFWVWCPFNVETSMKKLLLVLILAVPVQANAALITYFFLDDTPNSTTISMTQDGVTLNGYGVRGEPATAATIDTSYLGLGIVGNSSDQINTPSTYGNYEEISFVLPTGASWVSLSLSVLFAGESAGVCGADTVSGYCATAVTFVSGTLFPEIVDLTGFANAPVATVFAQNPYTSGGFRISSLTLRTASVPEPGTLSLLGAGLLGFALLRRRRAA